METSHDPQLPAPEAERGMARLLRHRTTEPLERAKATIKDRLLHQMMDGLLDELSDPDAVAEAALRAHDPAEAVAAAAERVKARLFARAFDEAADAVRAQPEPPLQPAPDGTLDAVTAAYRRRLHERAFAKALGELAPDALDPHDAPEEAFRGLVDGYKAQLQAQAFEQAVDELRAFEADAADVPTEALRTLTAAVKQNLLEQILDQALDEISDEVDPASLAAREASAREEAVELTSALLDDVEAPEAPEAGEATPDDAGETFFLAAPPGDGPAEAAEPARLPELDLDEALPEDEEEAIVYYLYGVRTGEEPAPPEVLGEAGIEGAYPIFELSVGGVGALVSHAPAAAYGAEALAVNLLDPTWAEAQRRRHQGIVDALGRQVAFLPLPFGTIYTTEDELSEALSAVQALEEVKRLRDRHEWRLRVYRDADRLHKQIVEHSEAIQGLMAEIKSKPKAEAAALKRKMVAAIHEEIDATSERCTNEVHERFGDLAEEARPHALSAPDGARGELLIDTSYLLHETSGPDFQDIVDALRTAYGSSGFRFETAGPASPMLFSRLTDERAGA